MRALGLALAALAVIVGSLALFAATARNADKVRACSIGVSEFESYRATSQFAALVDVVAVGGAENAQPTLTPTATTSSTPTASAGTPALTPSPTEPAPPARARTPLDLTGYGATVDVVRAYRGPSGRVQLDEQARESVERAVRHQEALPPDVIIPCEPGLGTYRWTQGARYVVFAQGAGSSFETIFFGRFRVIGDEVILQDDSVAPEDRGYIVVGEETYNAFLGGVQADRFENEPYYHIRAARIPLATFERMIRNEPPPVVPPPIVPPRTGSAGLRSFPRLSQGP
jgi:hypothetical protein